MRTIREHPLLPTGIIVGAAATMITGDVRWLIVGIQLGLSYETKRKPPKKKKEDLQDYFDEVTAAHSSGLTIPMLFGRTKTKGNVIEGYKQTIYINDEDLDPMERDTSVMHVALGRSINRTILEEARLNKELVDISVNNWGRDHPDGGKSDFPGSVRSTWEYDQLYATNTKKRLSVDSEWVRFFEPTVNNILAIRIEDGPGFTWSYFTIAYHRQYPDGRVEKTELVEGDFVDNAGWHYWWASVTGTSLWRITFEFDSGEVAMPGIKCVEIKMMDCYTTDILAWTFTPLDVTPTYFQFYPGFPYHAFRLNQNHPFNLSSLNFEQITDSEEDHPVELLRSFLTASWGLGYPQRLIDQDSFDEVKTAVPSATFDGEFLVSSSASDIIAALLLPIKGILIRSGGKLKLIRDVWSEPTAVFDDLNIRPGSLVINKSGTRDLKTRLIGTWRDSSQDWLIKEIVYDLHDLQLQFGVIPEEIELIGITDFNLAREAMEYLGRAKRVDYSVGFKTSDRYANVEAGDLIIVNYSPLQLTEIIRIYEIKESEDGGYIIVGIPFFAPVLTERRLITTVADFEEGTITEMYSVVYEDGAVRVKKGTLPTRDPRELP